MNPGSHSGEDETWSWSVDAYYKDLENLPVDVPTPQRFVNGIFSLDTNGCPVNVPDCHAPGQTYAQSLANGGIDAYGNDF